MRRASSARGSANSMGSAAKAESWPTAHGGYPSDRKRSFGHRVKKTASAPFVFLKKSFSGRSHRSARKRAPTPTHAPVHKSNCRGASPPLLKHHQRDASSMIDLRTGAT